jgi:hypothetical protein
VTNVQSISLDTETGLEADRQMLGNDGNREHALDRQSNGMRIEEPRRIEAETVGDRDHQYNEEIEIGDQDRLSDVETDLPPNAEYPEADHVHQMVK